MFVITFENHIHRQWMCDLEFESLDDAKDYLFDKGFKGSGYTFERGKHNWSEPMKAYVKKLRKYNKKSEIH